MQSQVLNINWYNKMFALGFLSSMMGVDIGYCLKPLLLNLINSIANPKDFRYDFSMPMKSFLPYDTTILPAYLLTYAAFVYRSYAITLISVSSQTQLVS
jgi:hypothetical protein